MTDPLAEALLPMFNTLSRGDWHLGALRCTIVDPSNGSMGKTGPLFINRIGEGLRQFRTVTTPEEEAAEDAFRRTSRELGRRILDVIWKVYENDPPPKWNLITLLLWRNGTLEISKSSDAITRTLFDHSKDLEVLLLQKTGP